ncbi:MAG: hypothetical protein A3J74_10110 [Elusimicrobia bacterium RIFCSPHIGHO2_02_FULL_57_9]|nr:MAG: hypothetical protein A3J74_10110 [Elusimicrobia bacterium RIFCSPHIGHO2_02_FULL_57_9]
MKKRTIKKKIAVPSVERRHSRHPSVARPLPKGKVGPIRKQLLAMRDDLMNTVRNQQVSDTSGDIGDPVDQASQSIEKELLFELSDNERTTLDQIEAALRKIGKGTYGVCESCQQPIAKQRLSALPFARYCIGCQSSSESSPELVEPVPELRGFGGGETPAE